MKMLKNCSLRSTFVRAYVQKMHAAVAKGTFGSENVKKTVVFGALLDVPMSNNCTGNDQSSLTIATAARGVLAAMWGKMIKASVTTAHLSYRFPILELPPPPCAVLLVDHIIRFKNSQKNSYQISSAGPTFSDRTSAWWKAWETLRAW